MRRHRGAFGVALMVAMGVGVAILMMAAGGVAQQAASAGPYKVLKTAKAGEAAHHVYADDAGRRLYIPRTGQTERGITVFDLDTLASAGRR